MRSHSKDFVCLRAAAVALLAVLAAALPAPAAAAGEFVTSGPCTNRVFEVDSTELRLDTYARETTVTLWGPLMQFARFPSSSNASVTASLRNARSAATNANRGCERLSSINLVLKPNGALTTAQKSTVTVQYWLGSSFSGTFALPVTLQALSTDIAWGPTGALANCLRRQNGDLARLAGGTELSIQIPRDLRLDPCLGPLVIDAALEPSSFIDAAPDNLAWQVDRFGPVTGRGASRTSEAAACLRGDCRPQVPLLLTPDWANLAALPHPSSVVIRANVFFAESSPPSGNPDLNDSRRLQQLKVTVNTTDVDSGFPTARCIADPSSGPIGTTVTFDSSGSTPAESPLARFDWDFDDLPGSERTFTAPGTVAHTFASRSGLFNVTLTVTDAAGNASTDACEVFILAPRP